MKLTICDMCLERVCLPTYTLTLTGENGASDPFIYEICQACRSKLISSCTNSKYDIDVTIKKHESSSKNSDTEIK